MGDRRQDRPAAEDVRAAIAGWQLRIQTDVKRTSSLPTSMFDACDPMVEAALADSAAHIFRRLMAYGPPPGYEDLREDELRAESVTPREIATMCVQLAGEEQIDPPDLTEGSDLEYLWILLDFCLEERGPVRERARETLHAALGRELDVARIGEEFLGKLREMLDPDQPGGGEGGDTPPARRIRLLCEEIEQRVMELRSEDPSAGEAR